MVGVVNKFTDQPDDQALLWPPVLFRPPNGFEVLLIAVPIFNNLRGDTTLHAVDYRLDKLRGWLIMQEVQGRRDLLVGNIMKARPSCYQLARTWMIDEIEGSLRIRVCGGQLART